MSNPEYGSKWLWTDDFHPIIDEIPVVVEESEDNLVVVRVIDQDIVESDISRAKETYSDNGHDKSNVEEVHPFVQFKKGEIVGRYRHSFYPKEQFFEDCSKA